MEIPPRLETIENWRKRLIFRSWHRGTREMDLIMGSFAEQHVPGFGEGELLQYESLLMENDPDVYNWYIGVSPVPANILTPVIEIFLKHKVVSRP
ncbi:MAG: succinate dehydrogenase assembly factor 2 [Alphaproteobacteria bacterium]|nr:succinate dehydrogenase assembly factor 2 [Alphaproteobacteria bacterium]